MKYSIMIEGQNGLTWPRWQRLVEAVDRAGFAGLFRSDHFTNADPPDKDSLEMVVSLTYAASHSRRIRFGPLVAPVSFRDPIMLARQAAALDDLSGGRMVLGLGAGWQQREHELFGYELGDMRTRMDRFEEAMEVVTRLLRTSEPVELNGRFYRLRGARLLPRPERPNSPLILIGGAGKKRTLPLVSKYADEWNTTRLSPEEFHERSELLDELLRQNGRQPSGLRRSMMTSVFYAHDEEELQQHLTKLRASRPQFEGKTLHEVLEMAQESDLFVGTIEQLREQFARYEAVGADELMLRWTDMDDLERLEEFGEALGLHAQQV